MLYADPIINEEIQKSENPEAAQDTSQTPETPPASQDSQESAPPEADGTRRDSSGNIITYPKSGETFKKTAERLGFKEGTPEYDEFVNANKNAYARTWFQVEEEVVIPKSIEDKTDIFIILVNI